MSREKLLVLLWLRQGPEYHGAHIMLTAFGSSREGAYWRGGAYSGRGASFFFGKEGSRMRKTLFYKELCPLMENTIEKLVTRSLLFNMETGVWDRCELLKKDEPRFI